MLERRLKLGSFWGIKLYVHWTFALLVGYIIYVSMDQGPAVIGFSLAVLFGIFFCVTLHEYGHALAARRFGIPTVDITLLPIGGVARLMRMPRVAWQELVVAVAGPAVNVVIVAILLVLFYFTGWLDDISFWAEPDVAVGATEGTIEGTAETISQYGPEPSLIEFGFYMLAVNSMLILFNMIPAFPMDGGRVLRSLLAMVTDYGRATKWAFQVGLVCAAIMAYIGLTIEGSNMMIFIAAFISYAGYMEARQVAAVESVRGLKVSDVMIRSPAKIAMGMEIDEIARQWQLISASSLPVVANENLAVGVLHIKDVIAALNSEKRYNTTAGMITDHEVPFVRENELLEDVILNSGSQYRQAPVVDSLGNLIGWLDFDSMLVRGKLTKHLSCDPPTKRFDQLS